MHDDRRKILEMLAAGRLTPAEADRQLEALDRNAERPVIDVGADQPPSGPWTRWAGRFERLQSRYRLSQHWPYYLMIAPVALALVGLALAICLAVLGMWLAVPTLVLYWVWNHGVVVIVSGLPPLTLSQAFALAFVMMLLMQGVRRWRR